MLALSQPPCPPCSNEAGNEIALVPIAFELKHRNTAKQEAAAGRTLPEGQGIVYARQELVDNPASPGGEVSVRQRVRSVCRLGMGGSGDGIAALPAVGCSGDVSGSRPPGPPHPPQALWSLAKHIFRSMDSGFHQLISHWLASGEAGATERGLIPAAASIGKGSNCLHITVQPLLTVHKGSPPPARKLGTAARRLSKALATVLPAARSPAP